MTDATLIARDLQHIWHPCSQMKDYASFQPVVVTGARGSYIELDDGRQLIDAISSWWCKSLGHGHPRLQHALIQQMQRFEHVILANTTNATIVALSEKLAGLTDTLQKVFYAGDGSSAVEVALKLSLHTRKIRGESQRTRFATLQNAYHGETSGALSVSDLGIYRSAYAELLFEPLILTGIPYVTSTDDPRWHDCSVEWAAIQTTLDAQQESLTAIIVEPILQGSGGMQFYSQDFLNRLRQWTAQHGVHLIADEILTGLGRTGKWFACDHANIEPDILCLGKSLTSGWLPFSAVLMTNAIYDTFYDDYANGNSFLHSHTFSGNALGASIALEVLQIMEEINICDTANTLGQQMLHAMQDIAQQTGRLCHIRQLGAMVAADLIAPTTERQGYAVYQAAMQRGALLRPLGNTLYWLPPLTMTSETVAELADITLQALRVTPFTGS